MEKIPITSDGKLKVEEELKSLKTTERPSKKIKIIELPEFTKSLLCPL